MGRSSGSVSEVRKSVGRSLADRSVARSVGRLFDLLAGQLVRESGSQYVAGRAIKRNLAGVHLEEAAR